MKRFSRRPLSWPDLVGLAKSFFRPNVCAGLVLISVLGAASATSARTWTHCGGEFTVEATLLDYDGQKLWLRRHDGRVFVVLARELVPADRQFAGEEIKRWQAQFRTEAPSGHPTVVYAKPRLLAQLANEAIGESSGMACSRRYPGVFWTHNDSGDDARLYAFNTKGQDLGSCLIEGVTANDFEDIASLSLTGKSFLLVGDTGNNGLGKAVHTLYLIEEPQIDPSRGVLQKQVPVVLAIHFSYDNGHHNCEALAVDPVGRSIVLVTKQHKDECCVYQMPWPEGDLPKEGRPLNNLTARKIAILRLPPVTALDISPDGRRAVVLTYHDAYEFYRAPDETWADAFGRPARLIPMPQRQQGESICYGRDGKTLYLTSEKRPTPLWEVAESGKPVAESGR